MVTLLYACLDVTNRGSYNGGGKNMPPLYMPTPTRCQLYKLYMYIHSADLFIILPSVLWRCWLSIRKGIWPVKTEWWGAGVVIWSEVQTCTQLSWCHCHSLSLASVKSRLVFTFLVPAHPGSPGKRAVKCVCVNSTINTELFTMYCRKTVYCECYSRYCLTG